jgi:GntR family transcriptional regulator
MSAIHTEKTQPRYQDVADALLAEIGAGTFAVGAMLPTELELCERFGVSRYTVREALRRLEAMGLVARRQGSGTVVQAAEPGEGYVQSLNTLSELLQYPPETRLHVTETEKIAVDKATARVLRCRVGAERVRVSGVRRIDASGKPICWTDIYLLPEYAGVAAVIGKESRPVYSLVEEEFGEKVAQVAVEMFASGVPEKLAAALAVAPGTPAMTIIRRYTGKGNRVYEVSISVHPEDRFTYSIALKREWRPLGDG